MHREDPPRNRGIVVGLRCARHHPTKSDLPGDWIALQFDCGPSMVFADSESTLDVCYDSKRAEGGRASRFRGSECRERLIPIAAPTRKNPSRQLFRRRCQTFCVNRGHQEASAQHARPRVRLAATHPVAIGGGFLYRNRHGARNGNRGGSVFGGVE